MTDQPKFLNCALEVNTFLEPAELLRLLKKIENDIGRKPGVKWGPRVIDIDILLYDLLIYTSEDLNIPHPYMHDRKFVLEPLAEIAPNAIHPVMNKYIRELLYDNALSD
jgi:2-amino-4-hydroxy-6-hydroxymethyldihydropteridine diphosphokinase